MELGQPRSIRLGLVEHLLVVRRLGTPQQIKAVANAPRLQVLRLCDDRVWTDKELVDRRERGTRRPCSTTIVAISRPAGPGG